LGGEASGRFEGAATALAALAAPLRPADAPVLLSFERPDGPTAVTADTERVLDEFFERCLARARPDAPALGVFVGADAGSGDVEQPAVLPACGVGSAAAADARLLRAFGAGSAQACLGALPVDVAERLPPLAFRVLLEGPDFLRAAPLGALLAHLSAWDPTLAAQYRSLLLVQVASMDLERRNASGLAEELNDLNKEDLLRRDCLAKLINGRVGAWEALRAGFLDGGGSHVRAAVAAAAGPDASPAVTAAALRSLAHGTRARSARERARAVRREEKAASEATIRAASTECPHCHIRVQWSEACFHMRCTCCGQFNPRTRNTSTPAKTTVFPRTATENSPGSLRETGGAMRARVSGHQVKTMDRAHKAFSALSHL